MFHLSTFRPARRPVSTSEGQDPQSMPPVTPAADVLRYDDRYEVHLALPGVRREDIRITSEKSLLVIEAHDQIKSPQQASSVHREFGNCRYRRSFSLNEEIDQGHISAKLEDGILRLSLPKRAEVAPRSISIRAPL
ncbi:MAG: Hsp20/alpha crystallin family protein [Planctomycetota bacterium]|nr:MAG: Hsp20/alpha crystallin family protein [Planctomycetota bacterium]